jgi:uracil-DNA glycosylase
LNHPGKKRLKSEFESEYFKKLTEFVDSEYASAIVYPPEQMIFDAFNLCPFDKVKVVIIGQDSCHGESQAHRLCFSVTDGIPHPPSLVTSSCS